MWAQRHRLARNLALALTFAAIASGIATYIALTGSPPFGPDPKTLLALIILDLVLLLPLGVLVAQRLVRLWVERRKGRAGSRLHARLVLLFGLLAMTPAIIVAVFSALFFNFGIQAWFSDRVGTALRESLAITDSYLAEKYDAARSDLQGLADDVNKAAIQLMGSPRLLEPFVLAQARARGISGVYVFDANKRVLVDSGLGLGIDHARDLDAAIPRLKDNDVIVLTSGSRSNILRAMSRLAIYFDADVYLVMERPLDVNLVRHVGQLRNAVEDYVRLEGQRSSVQLSFYLLFSFVSLLLLLAAIWLGFMIANQLVRPIGDLITAAERVGTGELNVRVNPRRADDELGSLARSFNRMTAQLARNREELIEANRQLDARREFTETVLTGVSAGVIGLDAKGRINLPNRSAAELLAANLQARIGDPLGEVVPEMGELVAAALERPEKLHDREIQIMREGRGRTLLARVGAQQVRDEVVGFVITFDDITELQSAQRKAAWADVARRIAHEIKNPLTPIQLSAERLRRKYLAQITGDPDTFKTYTDTIIRQVGDIGRLVDEFSSFARMPVPVIRNEDLRDVANHALFLERNAHPEIEYVLAAPGERFVAPCDARLVGQAVINLLRNAAAAILEPGGEGEAARTRKKGRIEVRLEREGAKAVIAVLDNGKGLPVELLPRLTEPYVTTRARGTGLGLAIARKVMEDHGGELRLENRAEGGARVALIWPAPAAAAVAGTVAETPVARGQAAE
ncbi:MAG TPA: PAS domain-containing sensor histidine kinase [Alphaproteobacteria bacterium]